jgi:GNAT superfamily N-acetyltransferase
MVPPDPVFDPISVLAPGALAEIIGRSYASLLERWPERWGGERRKWEDLDRQAFARPQTVGRCVFVTRVGSETLGLGSYDPRPGPLYGIVGQNCVLPKFRGRGIGTRQVREILRRLGAEGIRSARVTTSEHPFFDSARRMYERAGFVETRRFPGGPDPLFRLIELELELDR